MAQGTVTTIVEEPVVTDVDRVSISGDFSDTASLQVFAIIDLRDNAGGVQRRKVDITDVPGMQGALTALINAILPRAISDLETELGTTFQ